MYALTSLRAKVFGHDTFGPVSGGFIDDRNGWGATIVDAMDTMYLMDLQVRESFSLSVLRT